MHDGNGHHQPDPLTALQDHAREASAFMASQVEQFTTHLDAERAVQEKIKALLTESQARERQLAKIVSTLTGETTTKAPGPKPKAAKRAGSDMAIGHVSVQRVWDLIQAHYNDGDQFTIPELRRHGDVDPSTTRRSVAWLRENELLRLAGLGPRPEEGGRQPQLWALMPGAAEVTDLEELVSSGA